MIANIIATIMMALGVASGTKAPSNTFYDEREKPQIKKSISTIDITEDYYKAQTYSETYMNMTKYYIDSPDDTYIYYTDYLMIQNTQYSISEMLSNRTIRYMYGIYKITNFYNSTLDIEFTCSSDFGGNYYSYELQTYRTEADLDSILDLTLNGSTPSTVHGTIRDVDKMYYNNQSSSGSATTTSFTNTAYNIIMEPQETITIVTFNYANINVYGARDEYVPGHIHIQGTAVTNQETIEIVDVPGLMFTIIGLPFSFISTAFNLTLFPNTPYAVNFSNLFMVILATFILLWIIKKVLK